MNIVLLSTSRALPASVVESAREELSGIDGVRGPDDLTIDVVTWLPPAESLEKVAREVVVVGPAQVPKAAASTPSSSPTTTPQATEPIVSASAATSPLQKVRRVLGKIRRRVTRMLRRLIKGGVSRQFWKRSRGRDDVASLSATADVIIALDTGGARAGWHLARRYPSSVATFGVTAAVREIHTSASQ